MFRCLVMSDIHGNVLALDAVIDAAGPADLVITLGDYIGFGLHSNEVIARLKALPNLLPIHGNWDPLAQHYSPAARCCPPDAHQDEGKTDTIFRLGTTRLLPGTKAFLGALPMKGRLHLAGVSVTLVHGSVLHPMRGFLDPNLSRAELRRNASASQSQLVLHGDTHVQGAFEADGVAFVNPGSVGWPSDGDWRPAYAILSLDQGRFEIEFGRAEYDAESVYLELEQAGLPNAKMLLCGCGIWRNLEDV